ncbi:MAG: tetratricopeptide repeat protein [Gammaproteobacteria bacterium]|jgi:hypothetical protein|nr:tetratricopeptide repeat protein [Gammaproteobacteria bacterium]
MTPLARTIAHALAGSLICALLAVPAYAASIKQAKKALAANDYDTALTELKPLARSGNAQANNLLGLMYMQGNGVAQDQAQAKAYFEAGANTGHLESLRNLNILLDVQYKEELKTVKPAAQGGDSQSQTRLGRMYEFGHGTDPSPTDAFIWYQKAAKQNDLDGAMNLARAYNFGIGTKQDLVKAEAIYLAGAKQNHIDSMFFLGTMHFAQISQAGADADRQAYAWLKLAADSNHAAAAAMVTRLTLKLGDQIAAAEALYKAYRQTIGN